jgi:hypothetical protein
MSDLGSQGFSVWNGTEYVAPEPKGHETLEDAYLYHYTVEGNYGEEWHELSYIVGWKLPLSTAERLAELESRHRREMRLIDTKTGAVIKVFPYTPYIPKP